MGVECKMSPSWWVVLLFIGGFLIGGFLIGFGVRGIIDVASGQDFDPCFVDNDMYQKLCDQQQNNAVIDDMLERTQQWNNLDCSNTTNFDECDKIEDEPEFCEGNLTRMDREICNG
jgi:hypothetical protein